MPDLAQIAGALAGVTVSSLESLVKIRHHEGKPLADADLAQLKKELVERDSAGPGGIHRSASARSTTTTARRRSRPGCARTSRCGAPGDLKALPMGYLLCGPVGTGKTFLVECLAGEAGVPVVKLKNFRDRWVGSSEGNLEKIFRLIRALGRCMVFIDEADQTLGKRDSGSNDSGLSGRIYSMIAQEMSDSGNRGRVLWLLASSRPDLIEVDLKRPGRIDVKVPLLPTSTAAESAQLVGMLAKRYGLELSAADLARLEPRMPTLLTPGRRRSAGGQGVSACAHAERAPAARRSRPASTGYQNPVPADVLEFQMRIAIREATDLGFVPPAFRAMAQPERRHERQALLSRRGVQRAAARHADPAELVWLAAFGLLGALINPGLWLIGAGLEGLYLWWLSSNERFRATVDAAPGVTDSTSRYEALLARLDSAAQSAQYEVEREAAEIVGLLQRSDAHGSQIGDVRQMAWLHLKLLAARAAFCRSRRSGRSRAQGARRAGTALPRAAGRAATPMKSCAAASSSSSKSSSRGRPRTPMPSGAANWSTPSSAACASRSRWCANRRCWPPRKATWRSRSTPCRPRSTKPIAGSRISASCSRASTISPTSRHRRICWHRSRGVKRGAKVF